MRVVMLDKDGSRGGYMKLKSLIISMAYSLIGVDLLSVEGAFSIYIGCVEEDVF